MVAVDGTGSLALVQFRVVVGSTFSGFAVVGAVGSAAFLFNRGFSIFIYPVARKFPSGPDVYAFLDGGISGANFFRDGQSGIALALQLGLKLYYGFFGLVAGLGQLRSFLWAALLTLGAGLLLLPWLGPALWFDYAHLATGFSGRPETAVTAYQTINSFFAHLFRYDARWNPQPVANLPVLAQIFTLAVDGVLVISSGSLIWKAYRAGLKPKSNLTRLITALALTLAPLLAPIAEEYHFTILALPLLVAVGVQSSEFRVQRPASSVWGQMLGDEGVWEGERVGRVQRGGTKEGGSSRFGLKPSRLWTLNSGLWTLSWFLLAWPFGYKEWPAGDWRVVAAYPRLYGTLLLWFLLVRLIRVELLTHRPLPFGQNVNDGQ